MTENLELRIYGDPILRRKADPVVEFGGGLEALVQGMFECMYREAGLGLAAPQVGRSRRVFVVDVAEEGRERVRRAFVNPVIVDGQLSGALAQGIGNALYEELGYDETGQPTGPTFMEYHLPRADEVPPLAVAHLDSLPPGSPHAFRGMGEGGTIGAIPAVANAVADALGVDVRELPLTPARVRDLLQAVGA